MLKSRAKRVVSVPAKFMIESVEGKCRKLIVTKRENFPFHYSIFKVVFKIKFESFFGRELISLRRLLSSHCVVKVCV